MKKNSFDFLVELLETPSVSGFETEIQKVIKKRVKSFADRVEVDVHGNLIAVVNPGGKFKVMLAGHCDQIGMMVTHIDEHGYLYFRQVGGIDPSVVPGSKVIIHTHGGPLVGVIGHKPVHLLTQAERGQKVELSKLWIDIGVITSEEAKKLVTIGDPVTYALGVEKLQNHVIASPGLDDRVGAFVVMETLRLYAGAEKSKKDKDIAVYAVSTVQEELGLRGAKTSCYNIDPQVGIAVDVTHASDNPAVDAKEIGTVKLGEGPTIARGANINPILESLLRSVAKKKKLKYQPLGSPAATGTDANVMQISRSGVATALIGLPNRYMHTQVELVDLRDLEVASDLLSSTILEMRADQSFIPQ